MTPSEVINGSGATAALMSPFWLPSLQEVSAFAALILPILGAAWLILQIGLKLYSLRRKRI